MKLSSTVMDILTENVDVGNITVRSLFNAKADIQSMFDSKLERDRWIRNDVISNFFDPIALNYIDSLIGKIEYDRHATKALNKRAILQTLIKEIDLPVHKMSTNYYNEFPDLDDMIAVCFFDGDAGTEAWIRASKAAILVKRIIQNEIRSIPGIPGYGPGDWQLPSNQFNVIFKALKNDVSRGKYKISKAGRMFLNELGHNHKILNPLSFGSSGKYGGRIAAALIELFEVMALFAAMYKKWENGESVFPNIQQFFDNKVDPQTIQQTFEAQKTQTPPEPPETPPDSEPPETPPDDLDDVDLDPPSSNPPPPPPPPPPPVPPKPGTNKHPSIPPNNTQIPISGSENDVLIDLNMFKKRPKTEERIQSYIKQIFS